MKLDPRGLRWSVAGATCALLAYFAHGGLVAGELWVGAVAIAAMGYGCALAAATGEVVSAGLTVVCGLAGMLAVSTVLARLGLLVERVQIGVVVIGFLACGLAHDRADGRPARGALAFALAIGAALVAIELLHREAPLWDGANHVFLVKRLWDIGSPGAVHHGVGVGVVGEAYFALGVGARAAGVFEMGVAPALLLLVAWSELARRDDGFAMALYGVVVAGIAVLASGGVAWSGVVFHAVAFFALTRRATWHAAVCGVALCLLRHEYILIGAPYVFAAFAFPRLRGQVSRRGLVIAGLAWLAIVIALELALAVRAPRAISLAIVLLAAAPLATTTVRLLGRFEPRSPLWVTCFATWSSAIALLFGAIKPVQHAAAAEYAVWIPAGLAVISCVEETRRALYDGAAALVLLLFVTLMILVPNIDDGVRAHNLQRVKVAIVEARNRCSGDPMIDPSADVRALQDQTPRGARLGFWGVSAGALDFERNQIRDLSSASPRAESFLLPLAKDSLGHVDYLLFEDVSSATQKDPWGTINPVAIAAVNAQLESGPTIGDALLFRVVH